MLVHQFITPESKRFTRPYHIALSILANYNSTFDLQLSEIDLYDRLSVRYQAPQSPGSRTMSRQSEQLRQMKELKNSIKKRGKELQNMDTLIVHCYNSQINESTIKY